MSTKNGYYQNFENQAIKYIDLKNYNKALISC